MKTNEIREARKGKKKHQKKVPPLDKTKNANEKHKKKIASSPDEIFTSRLHAMDYFTVDGVKLRTGYNSERDWYLLPIRELLDNAADFHTKHYRGASDCYIKTWITKNDKLLRIKVRNSNHKNIPILEDLNPIFDYDMRYGSKQNVYTISRGMLGDALKQILSLGYVLLHLHDDGNSFIDKQWDYPLIVRHNGLEQKVYLHVDKANQTRNLTIGNSSQVVHTDTEIEVVLPSNVGLFMPKSDIVNFCKTYPIFTTDISFEFRIVDDSTKPQEPQEDEDVVGVTSSHEKVLAKALSAEPPKAITKIDFPALHHIGKEHWTNSNSIYSNRPEEFKNRITNVHDKNKVTVYNVLRTYREGSNLPKTSEISVTIAELMLDPNKDKKIEKWYKQLKKTLPPPEELVLPYTTTNKERKEALVSRVGQIAPIDNKREAAYKVIRGFCKDGHGVIQFPYVFEILAVPLEIPIINGIPTIKNKTRFLGAVNYSVSPLSNTFEGEYEWLDDKTFVHHDANSIDGVLPEYGFHTKYGSKSRLPCVIIANLVTPRRDPHGYDKSRIDTQPFVKIIIEAVRKVAAEIPTFRAAGYRFTNESDYSTARWHSVEKKKSIRDLLKDFLVKERGMPA